MQEKNIIANTYWANNERFADVMNVGMFQEKVLTAEQLSERDGYLGHAEKEKEGSSIQRNRDVTKKAAFGTSFVILTAENQNDIHYAMPVRIMGYEFMDYNRQLKEIKAVHEKKKDLYGAEYISGFSKDDKLQPICTLVIYYGKEPWKGPTKLSDMMDFSKLPETVRNMVADHPIHIIDARRFEDSEKLETDARLFFGMIQRDENADEWEKYVEENKEAFQNISSDTYDAIATFTKTGRFLENKEKYLDVEGDVDMCKAMDDLIKRGEERGEKRGEKRGEERGKKMGELRIVKLIECMTADGMLNSIPQIATDSDFCQRMFEKYEIE